MARKYIHKLVSLLNSKMDFLALEEWKLG
jgi:hypothetical protein